MKSIIKTVGILVMAIGIKLAEVFWIGLAFVIVGGSAYFLADYDDYRCPCMMCEEGDEWND